ncbi:MAG: hypothetical protein V4489_01880 [Chlamydiota bacterium]
MSAGDINVNLFSAKTSLLNDIIKTTQALGRVWTSSNQTPALNLKIQDLFNRIQTLQEANPNEDFSHISEKFNELLTKVSTMPPAKESTSTSRKFLSIFSKAPTKENTQAVQNTAPNVKKESSRISTVKNLAENGQGDAALTYADKNIPNKPERIQAYIKIAQAGQMNDVMSHINKLSPNEKTEVLELLKKAKNLDEIVKIMTQELEMVPETPAVPQEKSEAGAPEEVKAPPETQTATPEKIDEKGESEKRAALLKGVTPHVETHTGPILSLTNFAHNDNPPLEIPSSKKDTEIPEELTDDAKKLQSHISLSKDGHETLENTSPDIEPSSIVEENPTISELADLSSEKATPPEAIPVENLESPHLNEPAEREPLQEEKPLEEITEPSKAPIENDETSIAESSTNPNEPTTKEKTVPTEKVLEKTTKPSEPLREDVISSIDSKKDKDPAKTLTSKSTDSKSTKPVIASPPLPKGYLRMIKKDLVAGTDVKEIFTDSGLGHTLGDVLAGMIGRQDISNFSGGIKDDFTAQAKFDLPNKGSTIVTTDTAKKLLKYLGAPKQALTGLSCLSISVQFPEKFTVEKSPQEDDGVNMIFPNPNERIKFDISAAASTSFFARQANAAVIGMISLALGGTTLGIKQVGVKDDLLIVHFNVLDKNGKSVGEDIVSDLGSLEGDKMDGALLEFWKSIQPPPVS